MLGRVSRLRLRLRIVKRLRLSVSLIQNYLLVRINLLLMLLIFTFDCDFLLFHVTLTDRRNRYVAVTETALRNPSFLSAMCCVLIVILRYAEYLFGGRHSLLDFSPTVMTQGSHTLLLCKGSYFSR